MKPKIYFKLKRLHVNHVNDTEKQISGLKLLGKV